MAFTCYEQNCKKSFSSKSNQNKHERLKNHRPQMDGKNRFHSLIMFFTVQQMAMLRNPKTNTTL